MKTWLVVIKTLAINSHCDEDNFIMNSLDMSSKKYSTMMLKGIQTGALRQKTFGKKSLNLPKQ
jgi:hypothetical protein